MRQLNKTEALLMLLGGLLMVTGAGAAVLLQPWAPWLFAPGAVLFSAMQMRQRYDGPNFVVRRLRRMVLLSDALFMAAALLLVLSKNNFLGIPYFVYVKYVHNNWIIVLLVAAILQLYTSHRISHELEKDGSSN